MFFLLFVHCTPCLRLCYTKSTGGGGGGDGILIFSYIHRLRPFFGVRDFEFQYFLGFSEK